jgi:hypothetical protein
VHAALRDWLIISNEVRESRKLFYLECFQLLQELLGRFMRDDLLRCGRRWSYRFFLYSGIFDSLLGFSFDDDIFVPQLYTNTSLTLLEETSLQ